MGAASKSKKRPFWDQLSLLNYGMVVGVQLVITVLWLNNGGSLPLSPEMLQGLFTILFLPVYLTFINYSLILKYRKPADVVPTIAGIMISCVIISSLFQYIRWSYRAGHGFVPPLSTVSVISFELGASMIACVSGIGLLYWQVKSYYRRHAGVIKPKKVRRPSSVSAES